MAPPMPGLGEFAEAMARGSHVHLLATQTKAIPPTPPPPKPSEKALLAESMKKLLLHGEYSDMKVVCEGFVFHVHRAILCSQSPFFKAAINGNFKEAMTNTIDLPEDDLWTIEHVLSFLYVGDYSSNGHLVDLQQAQRDGNHEPHQSSAESPSNKAASDSHNRTIPESAAFEAVLEIGLGLQPTPDRRIRNILAVIIAKHYVDFTKKTNNLPRVFAINAELSGTVIWYLAQKAKGVQWTT
ncbi:BTB/POZ protein [Aspergillus pseudoustus]|uniref:BTB/POZ protein n=1 Tax=Aspergillus pseudoustus TaxID=1810923 RepID=A0ABR4JWD4_9EURO